ncbi:LpxL/LpxP family Kdo(2)-lipid IV(A) lauroyl/palmitoleoyl acyltransferase [Wohlfahrtiimonas chitiniclastica]|uniref:LpxL/LpxP family Kdo(2)-lipid IV(A) lauroyl/palmitoleoyl acyltransferase n=1 Tax=Wohlfahrtiimonas chitiniclastica TaxID=400946 RepID=UPI0007B69C0B|nr:LpxL/LpxP family Kdo(2)-lipid IV(A) lauroyl/palmitoleoyl acyltransferase [Wohlfahrtiimonas chitiniclastica]KZX36658.1 protein Ddg [Wohlfahrtiimonas chitiniclastica]MBS7814539.1 LpxL/LpxP family Kdo(2)-lipid IV(A) lauroyl/palmitoleoyl acyltransferase [Wohlfahrtiimonas chitiniclastica]MBS7836093.1 LpxL/LpxP family Kdo(2)-lipid IV(A) lauroyl/palmitoleoyl acyltransferase [Wohlfahrtiimonas chitiniclastica]MBS7838268.1 LpxL/LpxP family Kdo(2)-lipid IV(A) lauroyl/palmitoleoyl acyltransferase [Wohlf
MQYHKPNWIKDHAIALGFWVGKYIARLPMPILLAAGKGVGKLSYYVAKKRRHIVERNIALCFPDLSKDAQTELVKENFNALGMGIFETLAAWLKPEAQVKELFIYEGLENLDAVKASGEGALLLTVHFCNLELGARAITLKTPFVAMYRQHKNRAYEERQFKMRTAQSQNEPVNRNEIRKTIKLLRQGKLLWYAPDQNYGGSDHVFVDFFGVKALMITATSQMAKVGKAKVLPYYCIREGNQYRVKILPALDHFPSESPVEDCERLNKMFESWIMQAPEQYLWAHRRFKTRPEGEKDLYE